jgi:hypothetical protein
MEYGIVDGKLRGYERQISYVNSFAGLAQAYVLIGIYSYHLAPIDLQKEGVLIRLHDESTN